MLCVCVRVCVRVYYACLRMGGWATVGRRVCRSVWMCVYVCACVPTYVP